MSAASRLVSSARKLAPYLLVELLLPGGTLIALILWLSQGMHRTGLMTVDQPTFAPTQVEKVISPTEIRHAMEERHSRCSCKSDTADHAATNIFH